MPSEKEDQEKPVTLSQLRSEMHLMLVKFYNDLIEPRFQAVDKRFDRVESKLDEHDQRFDDLYKKVEDLRQEYIISNEQMRRLDKKISGMLH